MASHLTDFVNIGPRTSLYSPTEPILGQLIIMCTWLGAGKKHIAKYTDLYRRIAPGAHILLIESNVPILISTYKRQRSDLRPAVAAILDILNDCGHHFGESEKIQNGNMSSRSPSTASHTPPKILMHTFSNGGTNTATQLLLELNSRIRCALPIVGLVWDSCPAKGTYWKSYDAMKLSLPKDMASQTLGIFACHGILILLYSWIYYGNENPASLNRRIMLDENFVRTETEGGVWAKGQERTAYLYSKEDRMCEWTDVTDHAKEARAKGWQVDEIAFAGSGHCAHYSKYEDQYAGAVERVWRGSEGEVKGV